MFYEGKGVSGDGAGDWIAGEGEKEVVVMVVVLGALSGDGGGVKNSKVAYCWT